MVFNLGGGYRCPQCDKRLRGDGERFECKSCEGGVFFLEGGVLVHAFSRTFSAQGGNRCISCQQEMQGSVRTDQWEDGDNSLAYVTCRHCGTQNF